MGTALASPLTAAPPKVKPLPEIRLEFLGTYASGIYGAGAAEIAAHDPPSQRLYVINSQAASVDVLDISNPVTPTKVVGA